MSEQHWQTFLRKVANLNAFVAQAEADQHLHRALIDCETHDQVVSLAAERGFNIARRWGEPDPALDTDVCSNSSPPQILPAAASLWGLLPLPPIGEERTAVLISNDTVRLELIRSNAAASPENFWYDQAEDEWVALLQGQACLRFENEPSLHYMQTGDQLLIPVGRRHRVESTSGGHGCLWLALFLKC